MTDIYKIAILTSSYPPKGGGIAAAHFGLAQCLQARHNVAIFAFDDDDNTSVPYVYRAKTGRWLRQVMKWLARRWVRHYAAGEPATNCERVFRTVPAMISLNRKIHSFDPDFILCPDNLLPGLALRKPRRTKLIWVAHHNYQRFDGNPLAGNHSWIDLHLVHRLERRAIRKSDAIVAVSEYMAEVTRSSLQPSQPLVVIRNSVDIQRINRTRPSNIRQRLGLSSTTPIIYIPSAGSAVKGERYTFELIRRLGSGGKAAFFLSGTISPALRFELDQLATEIHVYTPDAQAYDQNLSDVAACDLTVSPTLIENLSSALIESLALGIPVITFDVGGNKEIIKSNFNGHLSDYLDIENLIVNARLLFANKERLRKMKRNARVSVENLVDPHRVTDEYDSLFESLDTDEI